GWPVRARALACHEPEDDPAMFARLELATIATTFGALFLAELGDKTQLTVLSFVTGGKDRFSVILGASLALVASTVLAGLLGSALTRVVDPDWLKLGSAAVFLVVGVLVGLEAISGLRHGG
ncbi:MAG: TMEM165/GDT1 family protein, partial [Acidimicrobiales bacterium]